MVLKSLLMDGCWINLIKLNRVEKFFFFYVIVLKILFMIFIFRFKYLLNVILYFLFINVCNMDFKLER